MLLCDPQGYTAPRPAMHPLQCCASYAVKTRKYDMQCTSACKLVSETICCSGPGWETIHLPGTQGGLRPTWKAPAMYLLASVMKWLSRQYTTQMDQPSWRR
jgi:hypothetical protein